MYESTDKNVSHPNHYQSNKGLEVIDVIEAFTDGLVGIEATDTGNVIKYICRWKKKNGIQDLEKALWYLQHLVDHMKEKSEPAFHTAEEPCPVMVYECRICRKFIPVFENVGQDAIDSFLKEHMEEKHPQFLKAHASDTPLEKYFIKYERKNIK